MAIPAQDSVSEVLRLNNRGRILRQSIDQAWSSVHEKYPDIAWFRRKTTAAQLMWEYAVDFAIGSLHGTAGVQILPRNDTITFVFDESLIVRFKKADMELRTSNFPTATALQFHDQEKDMFGFAGAYRVTAAYVPNQFETQIDWSGIVARHNNAVIWAFEFDGNDNVTSMPQADAPAKIARSRVKLKVSGEGKDPNQRSEPGQSS